MLRDDIAWGRNDGKQAEMRGPRPDRPHAFIEPVIDASKSAAGVGTRAPFLSCRSRSRRRIHPRRRSTPGRGGSLRRWRWCW
ncbi:hypothetical protein PAHAL_9G219700 [Panicum hallii]|uniref:Uncharacterized protein n=1 Tax=Panicum hallii TaxID=206008 RepID=A0A2T8I218_9POAL|nr:hypothetical protein PAHAL_9G219700 [Panicum hallii]